MKDNYISCDEYAKRAQTGDIFRTVFASMGYKEIGVTAESIDSACIGIIGNARRCFATPGYAKCGAFIAGEASPEADAEIVAAAIEAALVAGIDDFRVRIDTAAGNGLLEKVSELCDEDELAAMAEGLGLGEKASASLVYSLKVLRLLSLYGLEDYVCTKSGDNLGGISFVGTDGDEVIMQGKREGGICGFVFDMTKCARMQEAAPEASVIFAEKDAQGLAYELAYTLRVNGCLVEGYIGGGDFAACEKYCKEAKAACMLRVYADGTLKIKDFLKNEITETTIRDFLGYYGGDDDGCDCGCDHDHEHHDHGCGCGHCHGEECGCDE